MTALVVGSAKKIKAPALRPVGWRRPRGRWLETCDGAVGEKRRPNSDPKHWREMPMRRRPRWGCGLGRRCVVRWGGERPERERTCPAAARREGGGAARLGRRRGCGSTAERRPVGRLGALGVPRVAGSRWDGATAAARWGGERPEGRGGARGRAAGCSEQ
ncbi:hypothetical protein PAHAL_6G200800 [Panicum hallii]|uniref:Uncharacterized protein n=1 Tax=Panicum hallii TaxID=206008 RepID=A0A2T8IGY0_9POAL|nr:hypothetical protein PAHAL_6G200800 [Panicum hallii]